MKKLNPKTDFETDDEYFAFLDLAFDLEKEWKKTLPRLTAIELLETFPEAKKIIIPKINEWQEERQLMVNRIKESLIEIRKTKDELTKDLKRFWLKITYGQRLLEIDRQIARLKHLLCITKGRPLLKNGVTEEMVERALLVPIQDVISQEFKKSGCRYVGLCPLHNEKSPSFFVYPDTNSFYCYGCGVGGNVINLIKLLHDYNFVEAVKWLNEK